jgi:5-methylcytosine-specific restriction enzyme A
VKRGKGLARKAELRRTPLKRVSDMAVAKAMTVRSKALGRKQMKRVRRDTGPDRSTRELVLARDECRCQRCGSPRDLQLQHRLPRQQGGTKDPAINLPSNLITLCVPCHRPVELERTESYDRTGMLVRRPGDPAYRPVKTIRGWLLLAVDGSFDVVSGPDGEETR